MMPGHDEEAAGHDPAERAMHEPADISGELLRLGTRQQHAIIEGMQKARLGNPAFLIDQDAVHHRDLSGRATEAEQCDAQPDAERLVQGHSVSWLGSLALNDRKLSHSLISSMSMSCVSGGQASTIATPGVERVIDDHPMPEHLVVVGEIGREPVGDGEQPFALRREVRSRGVRAPHDGGEMVERGILDVENRE